MRLLFQVFVVTAYFNIVKHVMTDFFPRAILTLAECRVSITRVQVWCAIESSELLLVRIYPGNIPNQVMQFVYLHTCHRIVLLENKLFLWGAQ
jgi:hypothetical protein